MDGNNARMLGQGFIQAITRIVTMQQHCLAWLRTDACHTCSRTREADKSTRSDTKIVEHDRPREVPRPVRVEPCGDCPCGRQSLHVHEVGQRIEG
jgi:hypothetical protein